MRRHADFLRVRRLGIRHQSRHFVVHLAKLPDQDAVRLGLAVSRRIGNAVIRNRVKRRLRESFRCWLKGLMPPGAALIVIARQGAAELRTQDMAAELSALLPQIVDKLQSAAAVEHCKARPSTA